MRAPLRTLFDFVGLGLPPPKPAPPAPPPAVVPVAPPEGEDVVTIAHAGEWHRVHVTASARARRVALRVDLRGRRIVLVVPRRMSRAQALRFAQEQAAWIARKTRAMPQPRPLAHGMTITVLGETLTIQSEPGARRGVWREGATLHVSGDPAHLPRRVRDWVVKQMHPYALKLAREKAARIDRTVTSLTLRDTVSQWGSCTPQGAISLSWRLAFAPPEVLDYVIAHEVAHLRHMNHGARFWELCRELTIDRHLSSHKALLRELTTHGIP